MNAVLKTGNWLPPHPQAAGNVDQLASARRSKGVQTVHSQVPEAKYSDWKKAPVGRFSANESPCDPTEAR
jgi:hypothetical protein